MLAPAAVVGVAALFGRSRLGLWAGVLVFVAAGVLSLQRVLSARTTFFYDYGEAANAATVERRADGSERRYVVASDVWWAYRYYIDSPDFLILPIADPAVLESNRAAIADNLDKGIRFLTLRSGGTIGGRLAHNPELEAYLDRFPAKRLPALEHSFADGAMRVEKALLVTIEP
jgi:hypothetical protein